MHKIQTSNPHTKPFPPQLPPPSATETLYLKRIRRTSTSSYKNSRTPADGAGLELEWLDEYVKGRRGGVEM